VNSLIDTATYAAQQSDRWLFVAMLVLMCVCVTVLFRYFTGRLDRLQTQIDLQTNDFLNYLKTANKEMLDIIALANATITSNSHLLQRLERKLNS
jgi:hypothetical protein